jgi:hypothetical protein
MTKQLHTAAPMSRIVAARSKSSNDPDQNINEVETPKMRDPAAFIDFLRSTPVVALRRLGGLHHRYNRAAA